MPADPIDDDTTRPMRSFSASTASLGVSTATIASTRSAEDCQGERDLHACAYCANLRGLGTVLPPKRCDYCQELQCQFCTLRFPLLHVKKHLPKVLKSNTRICRRCFQQHWQAHRKSMQKAPTSMPSFSRHMSLPDASDGENDGSGDEPRLVSKDSFDEVSFASSFDNGRAARTRSSSSSARRLAQGTSNPTTTRVVLVPTRDGVALWMSLFTATILLAVAVVEQVPMHSKASLMVGVYAVFLIFHPALRSRSPPTEPLPTAMAPTVTRSAAAAISMPSSAPSLVRAASAPAHANRPSSAAIAHSLPPEYRARVQQMEDLLAFYLSERCPWKPVRSNAMTRVFDTSNELPFPIFMIETFIAGVPIAKFMTYIRRTGLKDRMAWDANVARFDKVDEFEKDDVSIFYNAQRAFLGGFVSARDFCLLYSNKPNYMAFGSVEHPDVPEKPHHTRGTMHFGCFHCTEQAGANGEDGFLLRYILQLDVGGSLPVKLLYNGTVDTMEKMIKNFQASKKLFLACT